MKIPIRSLLAPETSEKVIIRTYGRRRLKVGDRFHVRSERLQVTKVKGDVATAKPV